MSTLRASPLVFVLWGEYFDEAATILFVTTLRSLGVRVKIVGLHGACVKGEHGVKLLADITLDEALEQAAQVVGVIVPSVTSEQPWWCNDPRLLRLVEILQQKKARWIITAHTPPLSIHVLPDDSSLVEWHTYSGLVPLATFVEAVSDSWRTHLSLISTNK